MSRNCGHSAVSHQIINYSPLYCRPQDKIISLTDAVRDTRFALPGVWSSAHLSDQLVAPTFLDRCLFDSLCSVVPVF